MRILHLIQRPQLRGAEMFASQIGSLHQRQGDTVHFIALFTHPAAAAQLQLDGPSLEVLALNEGNRVFDLAGYRTLARAIRSFNPDIVQANAADTLKYAALSRILFGWPGKLIFRNANKMGSFITSRLKQLYNQQLVQRVDLVASVSENCRIDFLETFDYPEARTRTLTIGTPTVTPPTEGERAAVRRSLGLAADAELLINVGSFVPEKNHLGLIDLFARIRQQRPQAHLVLVGDGKLRTSIEERIEEHGLSDAVHVLGFRHDAVDLVGAADLMLMPSFIEGMPGVILEAMVRAVPVVASDVGGIGEVVLAGQTGLLGDPYRPGEFAAAVTGLLDDTAYRAQLGAAARAFVLESKTIEKISAAFADAYRDLVPTCVPAQTP